MTSPQKPKTSRPRNIITGLAISAAIVVAFAAGVGARPADKAALTTKLIEVPSEISTEQRDALIKQGYDQAVQEAQDAAANQAAHEAAAEAARGIGPGTLVVGTDVQPGLYRTEAGADILGSCYWARLSSLSGDFDAIIANGNATGTTTVEIKASDVAFETACEWQPA